MDNTDLTIGNIVGATIAGNMVGYEPKNEFEKVCLKENGVVPFQIKTGADIDKAEKWYFNIPLTKNLLLAIGFDDYGKDPVHSFDRLSFCGIDINIVSDGTLWWDEFNLKYLHDLQNLANMRGYKGFDELFKD